MKWILDFFIFTFFFQLCHSPTALSIKRYATENVRNIQSTLHFDENNIKFEEMRFVVLLFSHTKGTQFPVSRRHKYRSV